MSKRWLKFFELKSSKLKSLKLKSLKRHLKIIQTKIFGTNLKSGKKIQFLITDRDWHQSSTSNPTRPTPISKKPKSKPKPKIKVPVGEKEPNTKKFVRTF